MNFSELTYIATLAALEAGALLMKGFKTNFQIHNKEGKHNLVTEYDYLSQKLIIEKIQSSYPQHHFLAEEEPLTPPSFEDILWIIDPLDGTVNFVHEIPFFAVSIAAVKKQEIVAGVVYNPMQNELFTATKGGGAYLNGKKLAVTSTSNLETSFLATGFPYNTAENPLHCIERFSSILSLGMPIRRLGVASLDLAYVAAARFDAFWEVGLHPWDMAAGKLLIEEAGGLVTQYDGSTHPIFTYCPLLATNHSLHPLLVKLLKEDVS